MAVKCECGKWVIEAIVRYDWSISAKKNNKRVKLCKMAWASNDMFEISTCLFFLTCFIFDK